MAAKGKESLSGSAYIVTGAGRGIGAAAALDLAARGASVALVSRTESELHAMVDRIRKQIPAAPCLILPGDVSDEKFCERAVQEAAGRFGTVHGLINNAGVVIPKPVTQVSAPDWDQTFAVNVRGPFLLARALFRIAEKDPHTARTIVNVSSLAGIRGLEKFPGFSAYTASKHAVIGLTEALTVEGKALGIHVYCVAPGAVDTKMLRDAVPFLKTNTQPEEVAGIIVDLCDPSKNPPATGTILELMTNA